MYDHFCHRRRGPIRPVKGRGGFNRDSHLSSLLATNVHLAASACNAPAQFLPPSKCAFLVRISHHVWTLLVGCWKGGASAPSETQRPPYVVPVPRAVPQARDCAGHGTRE